VCTDYVSVMNQSMARYHISLPDRQLACGPIRSEEGERYLAAMCAAANFAWANRQAILHFLRGAFQRIFGGAARLDLVYDVCHNIAKRERYEVEGRRREVLVHRKGATRAFPAGHREIPADYRAVGQPVFIPGSMGTASWVLAGSEGAMRETFGSVCHGAGRLLSRTAARKGRNAREERDKLEERGILVRSETRDGILEELPEAYKNVDEVIEVVHNAGLAAAAGTQQVCVPESRAGPESRTTAGIRRRPACARPPCRLRAAVPGLSSKPDRCADTGNVRQQPGPTNPCRRARLLKRRARRGTCHCRAAKPPMRGRRLQSR
jgi:tRNA-splicing ligase RtcB